MLWAGRQGWRASHCWPAVVPGSRWRTSNSSMVAITVSTLATCSASQPTGRPHRWSFMTATIAAYSGNAVIIEDIIKGLMNNQLVEKVELQTDDLVRSEGKRSSQSITPIIRDLYSPFDDKEKLGELRITPSQQVINEKAKIAATDVVTQIILIPDYHRTSASFNNRSGIAGV